MRLSESEVKTMLSAYQLQVDNSTQFKSLREFTVNFYCDRALRTACLSVSSIGDEGIETSAEQIDPVLGLHDYQIHNIAGDLNLPFSAWRGFRGIIKKLYQCFIEADAEEMTIAPLSLREDRLFYIRRADIVLDDYALSIATRSQLFRTIEMPSIESLTYIELAGQIAFVGNGAGLLMSAMDALRYHSHDKMRASCFLQLNDSLSQPVLSNAFELLRTIKAHQAIFFVVHSTRLACDAVARQIVELYTTYDLQVPIFLRLEGVFADEGYQLLKQTNHPNIRVYRTVLEAIQAILERYREEG